MAHELSPKENRHPLSIDEVIRRLRESYRHVEIDVDRASRELEESVQYMAGTGWPHYDAADIARSRQAIGRAVYVSLADDANAGVAYLSFLLEPEHERIFIAYESGEHEEASRELRDRLARVLDYDMELV